MTDSTQCQNELEEILSGYQKLDIPEIHKTIFSSIDYTSLNTADSNQTILQLVEEVNGYKEKYQMNVAAICVFPNFIPLVKYHLQDDQVKIACASASFPFSQTFDEVKYLETELVIQHGADEIDMVMPLGKLADNMEKELINEISEIKARCGHRTLKIILETSLLKDIALIKHAAELAISSGADFIKTSTGKNNSVASYEAVYAMCEVIKKHYKETGKQIGIKPAGGIVSLQEALKYYTIVENQLGKSWIDGGFFRIGTSGLVKEISKKVAS